MKAEKKINTNKESNKDKNIFSKIYGSLEKGYNNFSDWLTEKGIPINKLNQALEKKGIPPFALMGSVLLLIVIIILFLIFGFSAKMELTTNFYDPNGVILNSVLFSIRDSDGIDVFTPKEPINHGQKLKVPLSLGKTYTVVATKEGYDMLSKSYTPTEKKDTITFNFYSQLQMGQLIVRPIDSYTNKVIPQVKGTIRYTDKGRSVENIVTSNGNSDLLFDAPLSTRLQITLEADGYQTTTFDYQLNQATETKEHVLDFDDASFEGKESKVTINVVNTNGENIDDATIQIYDSFDNKLIDVQRSVLGKALFTISSGKTIRIIVTAENYKKYDSEEDNKTLRIIKPEETIPVTLIVGGGSLAVQVIDKDLILPLENAKVNLYNSNNSLIDGNFTSYDGFVRFNNLDSNLTYIVSACYADYFCEQERVSLENNQIVLRLEKINTTNSRPLGIHVFDEASNPLPETRVEILIVKDGALLNTGIDNLELDLTGYVSVPLRINQTYEVRGYYREVSDTGTVTISATVDNKVVLMIFKSKIVKIDLEKDGETVRDGHLLIKSKTDEILYDKDLDGTTVEFDSLGYKDLILEYTDSEGNKTTMPLTIGEEEIENIDLTSIQREAIDGYPVIDFVGVEDLLGNKTSFISVNTDYYLVFDVLFPENTKNGGAHIRVGEDVETDADNMSYGITGFKADTTNYRYSLTYNPYPGPGAQEIDYLNVGSSSEQNKWLNLEWSQSTNVGNQQIKVKIKAIDNAKNKAIINYRAWVNTDTEVLRDPQDLELLTDRSCATKTGLYADTKKIEIDIFDTPAECNGDICVSHKFIDSQSFEYSTDDFFAVKDSLYALETTIFSLKNKNLFLKSETTSTQPIISIATTSIDRLQFPTNINFDTLLQTETSQSGITVNAGSQVKVYTYFFAKDLGTTYVTTTITDETTNVETKNSFNVYAQKKMNVVMNPEEIVEYGQPISLDISDADTQVPIENATIKILNQQKENLGVIRASPLNGVLGKYTISQNFSTNRITLEISAHGYQPETKELLVADQTMIGGPDTVTINFGLSSSTSFIEFALLNRYSQPITDLRSEIRYVDNVDSLSLNAEMPIEIQSSNSINARLVATVNPTLNFNSARAVLMVYGRVGNKQVAKKIDVVILKGAIRSECLLIKPTVLDSYVGYEATSENTINLLIKNNCEKPLVVTPSAKRAGVTPSRETIQVNVPSFSISAGEELEYDVVIKNTTDTRNLKKHEFNISWDNEFYELPTTRLNVQIVDISQSIMVTPQSQAIPLTQHLDEFPAETHAVFVVKNTGNVLLRDVQISAAPNRVSANVQDVIYPPSLEELAPGQTVNITIQYKGKINLATIDDLQYKVSAFAPGIKSRVESSFQTYLWISPPACVKVTQESLNYSLEINKPRERSITLTNNCAEPIMVYGIDRSGNLYTDAFGSTNVEFYPSNAQQILPVGSSGSYVLKMTASQYEFPRLQKPIRFVGRTQSGAAVSSETTLITTEVVVQDEEVIRDYEQTYSASIPVCQQVTGESSRTLQLNFPIVSTTCDGQAGYCDALTGAHFILKKVQELQTRVVNDSAQIRNQTQNSGCSSQSYNAGYCQISDILQDSREVEFYLYLQNDAITIDLLRDLLTKDQRGTPKYNKINSYLVLEKSGAMSPAGISVAGGRLLFDSKLRGCGKYKITIDGYVAANHELILPERSALYISVEEMEKPESCSKFAENFIIYLPKDRELRQDSHYNTWLTMITGKKEFGEKVATDVFNDARRYAENLERSNRFNTINLFLGNITEKQDAVAKISFRTTGANQKTPEIIDILINNEYGSFNEAENIQVFDERVINSISKVVKGILDQDMADVCISENKEYLLLLSFRDPISGTLELKSKDNVNAIKLQPNQNCKTLEIKSSINETVLINHEEITGLFVTYNYQGREQTSLPISLTPGQAVDFNVCVTPAMTNTTSIIGSKFKVTATSKFRDSGAAGFRAQSLELDLTSFGITPLELFEIINSSVQKNSVANNELDTIEFYSFVDWDDTYSPNNTETQCDVIKKYLEKYPDTQKFFVTKEWCPELDVSDVAKKVNREKAGSNTWKFFENCFGRCALCSGIGDLALGIISGGVTLPMALKNIALDCGVFTCGVPSGIYYASQVTGDNWGILNGLKKAFSALGSAFSFVGDLISGAIDGVANLFGMGTAGAQELTVDQVESFSEDGQDESFLETMDQLRGGAGVGVGLTTLHQTGHTAILRSTSSPVMAAGSSRIITNFNLPPSGVASIPSSQMTIKGTPITSIYKPLPNPGYSLSEAALRRQLMGDIKRGGADWIFSLKGSDKGLQNVFHPDPSDAAELTRIMGPVNTVDDFMKLPHDDMYSVARILKHPNAQFRNPNTGGLGHPHTNKVVDRILHLTGRDSISLNIGTPDQTIKAVSLANAQKGLDQLDDALRSNADDLLKIDDEILKIQKYANGKNAAQENLDKLLKSKQDLLDAQKSLQAARDGVDDAIRTGTKTVNGQQVVEMSDDVTRNVDDVIRQTRNLSSSRVNWKFNVRKWGGIGKGIVCGIMGTSHGMSALKENGEIGNLEHSITQSTEEDNITTFEKKKFYYVLIYKTKNSAGKEGYIMKISLEIPIQDKKENLVYRNLQNVITIENIKESQTNQGFADNDSIRNPDDPEELLENLTQDEINRINAERAQANQNGTASQLDLSSLGSNLSLDLVQREGYAQKASLVQKYSGCTFPGRCQDMSKSWGIHKCSRFAYEAAGKIYNLNYNIGNAWDMPRINTVVWKRGVGPGNYQDHLVPGVLINISIPSSSFPQPSHIVLYVGKDSSGRHLFLHQSVDKSSYQDLSRYVSSGNRSVYAVLIPKTGYPQYASVVSNSTARYA